MSAQPISTPASKRHALAHAFARLPYWLLAAILLALLGLWSIFTQESYTTIFRAISGGIVTTVRVTAVAYAGSLAVGLLLALMRLSSNRALREFASFYVEIVRGVPMLVLLYYIAFVGAPGLVDLVNWLGGRLTSLGLAPLGTGLEAFTIRDLTFTTRAILALIVGYSAFVSEIFRAGIESIEQGQREAAMSLGMRYWQTMRFVVLPQAVRRVLPPLGNDLVAMLKDSALVSVLGVQDITRLGNTYATSTFQFLETYNIVAYLYLVMTVGLSLIVRWLERRIPNR